MEPTYKKVLLQAIYAGILSGLVLLVARGVWAPHWHLPSNETFNILSAVSEIPALIFLVSLARQAKPLWTIVNLIKLVFFAIISQFLLGLAYAVFFAIGFSIGLIRF